MIQTLKNYYHLSQAIISNFYYGFSSSRLKIIGVTGTDGKTTTTNLIYHILKEGGEKVAMISTIGAAIGGKTYDIGFHVTTPSSFTLQKYIKKAVDEKNKVLVLEVTSHALDQYRAYGIEFEIGVVTNITHEHLDYHRTYEKYVNAKAKLLLSSKVAVLNRDDEAYELLKSETNLKSQIKKIVTYGIKNDADVTPKSFPFKTQLLGEFNKYNCLAAIAVCRELGLSNKEINAALATFEAPIGRQEIVYPSTGSGQADFTVMIDFAHTPNSFKALLPDLKKNVKGRLIHVFGAAGKRDASKRPMMGEASSKSADIIILTSEDPRNEPIEQINSMIKKGIKEISNFKFQISNKIPSTKLQKNSKYLFEIPDRKEAIEYAISIAQKGDYIVLTGKSHEKSMNYGNGEEEWDEFGVAKNALKKYGHIKN